MQLCLVSLKLLVAALDEIMYALTGNPVLFRNLGKRHIVIYEFLIDLSLMIRKQPAV